jgi:hypothetical protein
MELTELFESINSELLTEEIKLQLSTLFESALTEAIKAKEVELEESNRTEIAEFKESLSNQIDEYLNYFVEEFVKENEDVVDSNVKVKTAERVLEAFQKVVTDFNVELSEEKIDESEKIDELTSEKDALVNQLIEAKKETELVKKAAMIAEKAYILESDLERDKLIQLAQTVEFDSQFDGKLDVFVEQIKVARTSTPIVEKIDEEKPEDVIVEEKEVSDSMKNYLKYL